MIKRSGLVWERVGKCKRCGDCCRPETLPKRIEVYKKWGMTALVKIEPCPYFLDGNPATCLIYDNRPAMCKLFPRHPADVEALPQCGYQFLKVGMY